VENRSKCLVNPSKPNTETSTDLNMEHCMKNYLLNSVVMKEEKKKEGQVSGKREIQEKSVTQLQVRNFAVRQLHHYANTKVVRWGNN